MSQISSTIECPKCKAECFRTVNCGLRTTKDFCPSCGYRKFHDDSQTPATDADVVTMLNKTLLDGEQTWTVERLHQTLGDTSEE